MFALDGIQRHDEKGGSVSQVDFIPLSACKPFGSVTTPFICSSLLLLLCQTVTTLRNAAVVPMPSLSAGMLKKRWCI